MKLSLPMIALLFVTGCTARGGYEGMRASIRNECARLPPSQYDDCMARADPSFEEYVRAREALRDDDAGAAGEGVPRR